MGFPERIDPRWLWTEMKCAEHPQLWWTSPAWTCWARPRPRKTLSACVPAVSATWRPLASLRTWRSAWAWGATARASLVAGEPGFGVGTAGCQISVCVQKDCSCSVEYCCNMRRLCQAVAHISCIPESDIGWGGGVGVLFFFLLLFCFHKSIMTFLSPVGVSVIELNVCVKP